MNPVRNSSGALNPAGIILELNPTAKQRGIISNGVKVRRFDPICIAVKNLEDARKQYEEILGIEPDILYNVNPLP
jgi:hypothetical protein